MRSQEIPSSGPNLLTHGSLSHAIGWLAIHPYPSPSAKGGSVREDLRGLPKYRPLRVASGYLPPAPFFFIALPTTPPSSSFSSSSSSFSFSSSLSSTAIVSRLKLIELDSCDPLGTRSQSNPPGRIWAQPTLGNSERTDTNLSQSLI